MESMSSMAMDMASASTSQSHDHMAMGTTTGTTAAAAAATTSTMSMGGGHGGGMGMGNGCKISMLWNWNTVDACFISSSWKITSSGMFAGSCIGVILLVMSLELLRRLRESYNRYLIRQHQASLPGARHSAPQGSSSLNKGLVSSTTSSDVVPGEPGTGSKGISKFRPKVWQQVIRSLIHMVQFGVAYFVMLLAMYYNGYFIICILIGAFLGHFAFEFQLVAGTGTDPEVTGCCG